MKYKLLKDLPLAPKGSIVNAHKGPIFYDITFDDVISEQHIALIEEGYMSEWLEEVKEPKTIYDLKEGDEYWIITDEFVSKAILRENEDIRHYTECFLTEREAKRNKLLRELATREKWLPNKGEYYIAIGFDGESSSGTWGGSAFECMDYHTGIVFRDEQEYNKYLNEEAKYLLFNI